MVQAAHINTNLLLGLHSSVEGSREGLRFETKRKLDTWLLTTALPWKVAAVAHTECWMSREG